MHILHLNDGNFNSQVITSKEPVLVDFWAEWCGPCKKVTPVIEELAKEYHGKVKMAKLNVEEGRNTASNFGIMSIPTLMLFKNGKIVKQIVGAISKHELKSMIDNNI
ncbi:MAG: thioredoxin [Candidatus Omnitrophica bacterium]|nr:thioredoxin [Candidatus Omnitrophota bacterium]MDD5352113.1 thioredoxin [Candidatus Omnitrophota bacterium]MDD5549711.1 thioredoxin [Candidatus Omnitrophota bacterium]